LNETLCRALLQARLTEEDVAGRLQVDPKTVRRWLEGRVPYLRHRWALAALLGLDETDLWPQLRGARSRPDEVQAVYPHMDAVPEDVWMRLFGSAEREIGILAAAAQPILESSRVLAVLAEKAGSGVQVRICLPDPEALAIAQRATMQGCGSAQAGDVRQALVYFAPLRESGAVKIRLHRAVVYTDIYYADDELLVAQHAHGIPSRDAPALYLHRTVDGEMAAIYHASFAFVWDAVGHETE